jgi:thymidine kinase
MSALDPASDGSPQQRHDLDAPRGGGRVEVVAGSMFSGKTEELIRRVKRALYARQVVQAFKPRIDDRYSTTRIVSHGAIAIEAVAVANSDSLYKRVDGATQLIAIDEAQFFDRGIVDIANQLADEGRRVILAGLDQDYLGRPFPPMPDLMAIAEDVTKVRAVCTVCGATACRSQRLIAEGTTVLVGGSDKYEARCRSCFRARDVAPAPHGPTDPKDS